MDLIEQKKTVILFQNSTNNFNSCVANHNQRSLLALDNMLFSRVVVVLVKHLSFVVVSYSNSIMSSLQIIVQSVINHAL